MEVLVVDDSRSVRAMLQGMLREVLAGVRVVAVNDLESALAWAGVRNGPDLVLLDLGLPGCAGLDALTRFRGMFPQFPVVVISATDDRDSIGRALGAGAIGYIAKSTPRDEIVAALKRVAEGGICVPPRFEGIAAPR